MIRDQFDHLAFAYCPGEVGHQRREACDPVLCRQQNAIAQISFVGGNGTSVSELRLSLRCSLRGVVLIGGQRLHALSITVFFFIGGIAIGLVRLELVSPTGWFLTSD